MRSTSCWVPGTVGPPGSAGFTFAFQWTFTILAPSGKGLPLPGMPALKALIITGFPTIAASVLPLWLMEITCQLSYPLNSENARPFGILRAYLSCVEVAACACDGAAVEAEAAARWGRLWMKRASFQVSSTEMVDFQ